MVRAMNTSRREENRRAGRRTESPAQRTSLLDLYSPPMPARVPTAPREQARPLQPNLQRGVFLQGTRRPSSTSAQGRTSSFGPDGFPSSADGGFRHQLPQASVPGMSAPVPRLPRRQERSAPYVKVNYLLLICVLREIFTI